MRSLVRVVCALGCATLTLSCGGSGGGGGPFVFRPALFAGDYHFVAIAGEGPPESGITTWGTMTANGISSLALGPGTQNRDRVVAALAPSPFPYSYSVAADGEMALAVIATEVARGGLSRSGTAALLGTSLATSGRSQVLVFLRKGAGLTSSTLTGSYHFGYLAVNSVTPEHVGTLGTATFDGAGGGALDPDIANLDGTFPPLIGAPIALTYSVGADGTVTTSGARVLHGGVLPSGEFAAIAGSTVNGEDPYGLVLVRQQTTASVASLQGSYTFVGLAFNVALGTYESVRGLFTADGAGGYAFEATVHRPGAGLSTIGPTTGTYAVAANGVLNVDAGFTIQGAVAPGGEFAFLGGGTSAASDPQLYILVRR